MFPLKAALSLLAIHVCLRPAVALGDFCDKIKDGISGDDGKLSGSLASSHNPAVPYAGIVPSVCHWESGSDDGGEGKQYCVNLCNGLFRDQIECGASRCVAWDGGYEFVGPAKGKKKDGKCFCTCACPNID